MCPPDPEAGYFVGNNPLPIRPPRICRAPGCSALTGADPYCAACRSRRNRERAARRPSRHEAGYDSRWVRARRGYLAKHPLCRHCEADGISEPATVVDHVVPHKGDRRLFWDVSNWQPLCKRHHDRKTAEESRFGRVG